MNTLYKKILAFLNVVTLTQLLLNICTTINISIKKNYIITKYLICCSVCRFNSY